MRIDADESIRVRDAEVGLAARDLLDVDQHGATPET
jgi:hypothetical protein